MKISVKAKTGAKEEKVEKLDEDHFVVSVKERPVDGKANMAIAKTLAKYFKIPFSGVILLSGFSSKNKIFDIE